MLGEMLNSYRVFIIEELKKKKNIPTIFFFLKVKKKKIFFLNYLRKEVKTIKKKGQNVEGGGVFYF